MRVWMMLVMLAFVAVGCGGDNLELCDGCGSPTPTPTLTGTPGTPTATPTGVTPTGRTATPVPSLTPTGPFGT